MILNILKSFFAKFKKNQKWGSFLFLAQIGQLVTLYFFVPKICCPYFFCILHSNTFPKCPNTCILVQWVKSYDHLMFFLRHFLVQNAVFSKFWKSTKKFFFTKTECTECLTIIKSMIYIFFRRNLSLKIWKWQKKV